MFSQENGFDTKAGSSTGQRICLGNFCNKLLTQHKFHVVCIHQAWQMPACLIIPDCILYLSKLAFLAGTLTTSLMIHHKNQRGNLNTLPHSPPTPLPVPKHSRQKRLDAGLGIHQHSRNPKHSAPPTTSTPQPSTAADYISHLITPPHMWYDATGIVGMSTHHSPPTHPHTHVLSS